MNLLIEFGRYFRALPIERQEEALDDPLVFREVLAELKNPKEPVQRMSMQYLAFPKFFLPIVSAKDRKRIRDAFATDYLGHPVTTDVDADLNEVNINLMAEQKGPVDYYREPWESMWRPDKTAPAPVGVPELQDDEFDGEEQSFDVELLDATDDLADQLHVPLAWLQECVDLLRDRPQLIFYGPPGTGKTFIARALAKHLADEGNVKIVQFHPAYSYEDFFEGFRPIGQGNGQIGFELKPGPLRVLVDQARNRPDQVFVLIIDEINRGNLAKIFGELYFLLEYRDEMIDLMYSAADGEPFTLPRNLLLFGTMNIADRSIALVDSAMRRRFAFVPLHPSQEPTRSLLRKWLEARNYPVEVAALHDELNSRISDPDFKIGPSYFMRPAAHDERGLERVWNTAILPLLEEHHFGDAGVNVKSRYGLDELRKSLTDKNSDEVSTVGE